MGADTRRLLGEGPPEPNYTTESSAVLQAELRCINAVERRAASTEDCLALAFSGGGIRSASYGMGLMQALAAHDKLVLMDYLSSVSGGGYLSSALTWYLSCKDQQGQARFDCGNRFPFGKKGVGNKFGRSSTVSNLLNYLRLHGNYLMPGKGLGLLAFVATFLRVMAGSFTVYFALLTLCFVLLIFLVRAVLVLLLKCVDVLPKDLGFAAALGRLTEHPFSALFLTLCGVSVLLFLLRTVIFSWKTYRGVSAYSTDVNTQIRLGTLLKFSLGTLLLGLLPFVAGKMEHVANLLQLAAGSTSLGAALGFLAHRREMISEKGLSPLQLTLAASLLLCGILLGAYGVADTMVQALHDAPEGASNAMHQAHGVADNARWWGAWLGPILLLLILFIAWRSNINLVGLNRMYRNRLMETFMQAPATVNSAVWAQATAANEALLKDMCQAPNHRPYHLINCNVVLPDSDNAGFRGRKGDSFVVSPLFCGSDATGWCSTATYGVNRRDAGLTLATAMAISGAAANPNAGISGQGPTTDKAVALVMSLLSLRLGFWAHNPAGGSTLNDKPNFLLPGLQALSPFRWSLKKSRLIESGQSEKEAWIELTDGGHFENLGLYELLRRRVRLVVVSDASEDRQFRFADLANAVEKARVDFGVKVTFDETYSLRDLEPGSAARASAVPDLANAAWGQDTAKRGFALARLDYPALLNSHGEEERAETAGWLVYVKPTLVPNIGIDVVSYRRRYPEFPHQSTADQFFDEVQFEAYRELGYQTGEQLLRALSSPSGEACQALQQVGDLLKCRAD